MTATFCAPAQQAGLAAQLLSDVDCRAFGLIERGYAALSVQGGPVSLAVNGLLISAVAFFGYRMLLGRGLLLPDALALAVKIGVVLLLASSWAGWQSAAYDAFARAPIRIAGGLLEGIGARDPIRQLQDMLDSLEAASLGYRTRAGIASPLVGGPAASAMTLNISSLILIQSIVGVIVVARIMLAILLAIAPVMGGFILFDATRGMVSGWLAAMATAAFVPLFVLVLSAIEFAVLAPLIARNLAEQAQGRFEAESVTPIGVISLIFAFAMLAAIFAGARIAGGIRIAGARIALRPALPAAELAIANTTVRADPSMPVITAANALQRSVRRENSGMPSATGALTFTPPSAQAPQSPARGERFPAAGNGYAPNRGWAPPRTPRRSRAATKRDG
jgi:type IV secretion system protein VirB6